MKLTVRKRGRPTVCLWCPQGFALNLILRGIQGNGQKILTKAQQKKICVSLRRFKKTHPNWELLRVESCGRSIVLTL